MDIFRLETFEKLEKLIYTRKGNKKQLKDIQESRQYLNIYYIHMNAYEQTVTDKIFNLLYDDMSYEQIQEKLKGDVNMETKKQSKKSNKEVENKEVKSKKKDEESKKVTSKDLSKEIDLATEEKIFMVTNMSNVNLDGELEVRLGKNGGKNNTTGSGKKAEEKTSKKEKDGKKKEEKVDKNKEEKKPKKEKDDKKKHSLMDVATKNTKNTDVFLITGKSKKNKEEENTVEVVTKKSAPTKTKNTKPLEQYTMHFNNMHRDIVKHFSK